VAPHRQRQQGGNHSKGERPKPNQVPLRPASGERNRQDRRVVMAALAERGWEALAAAAPEVFAAERRMLRDLSPAGRRELVQQLHRVAPSIRQGDRGR
jgi:hypothetical protein